MADAVTSVVTSGKFTALFIGLAVFGFFTLVITAYNISHYNGAINKISDTTAQANLRSAKNFNVAFLVISILLIVGLGALYIFAYRGNIARLAAMRSV